MARLFVTRPFEFCVSSQQTEETLGGENEVIQFYLKAQRIEYKTLVYCRMYTNIVKLYNSNKALVFFCLIAKHSFYKTSITTKTLVDFGGV